MKSQIPYIRFLFLWLCTTCSSLLILMHSDYLNLSTVNVSMSCCNKHFVKFLHNFYCHGIYCTGIVFMTTSWGVVMLTWSVRVTWMMRPLVKDRLLKQKCDRYVTSLIDCSIRNILSYSCWLKRNWVRSTIEVLC